MRKPLPLSHGNFPALRFTAEDAKDAEGLKVNGRLALRQTILTTWAIMARPAPQFPLRSPCPLRSFPAACTLVGRQPTSRLEGRAVAVWLTTPKAFHNAAQGRLAHPGLACDGGERTLKAFHSAMHLCTTPSGAMPGRATVTLGALRPTVG